MTVNSVLKKNGSRGIEMRALNLKGKGGAGIGIEGTPGITLWGNPLNAGKFFQGGGKDSEGKGREEGHVDMRRAQES
jgi:hypothetical protein